MERQGAQGVTMNYAIRTDSTNINSVEAFNAAALSMDDWRAGILWSKLAAKHGMKAYWDRKSLTWKGSPTLADMCYFGVETAFGKRMLGFLACRKDGLGAGVPSNWVHLHLWCSMASYIRGDKQAFYASVANLSHYKERLEGFKSIPLPEHLTTQPETYGEDSEFLEWLEALVLLNKGTGAEAGLQHVLEHVRVLFIECTVP